MAGSQSARLQKALILPMVMLVVALFETLAGYEVTRRVHHRVQRVAIEMVLYSVGFAVASEWISPRLKRLLTASRKTSHRQGGMLGTWLFFAAAYALLFYAFYLVDRRGGSALLPAALR